MQGRATDGDGIWRGAPRHPKSLREYLAALDELGDVAHIDREVSPDLEAAAISRWSFETFAPAPLMSNIRGHEHFRMLGGVAPFSSLPHARYARTALALGLDPETPATEIVEQLAQVLDMPEIPPVVVDAGPCQENVLTGDDVDLGVLPGPLLHEGDGGQYLNSIGTVIARTPDGSWTNWHVARCMIVGDRQLTVWTVPVQHFGMIHQQCAKLGQPMPVVIVQGPEPAATAASGMPIPKGVDEAAYLGAWFGEPLELVRAKTIDLDIPATSEIVIEGLLSVDERATEGPFGEYHGYLVGRPETHLIMDVTAITHRDNAILPVVPAGKPVDDDHTLVGLGGGAEFVRLLRAEGIPVTTALLVPETAVHLGVVTMPADWRAQTGIEDSKELCRLIGEILLKAKNQIWMSRLMVFDDDIDPADLRDVTWAFTTRCHPVTGQVVLENRLLSPLSPVYSAEERRTFHGPLLVNDGLLAEGPKRPRISSLDGVYPADLARGVRAAV